MPQWFIQWLLTCTVVQNSKPWILWASHHHNTLQTCVDTLKMRYHQHYSSTYTHFEAPGSWKELGQCQTCQRLCTSWLSVFLFQPWRDKNVVKGSCFQIVLLLEENLPRAVGSGAQTASVRVMSGRQGVDWRLQQLHVAKVTVILHVLHDAMNHPHLLWGQLSLPQSASSPSHSRLQTEDSKQNFE